MNLIKALHILKDLESVAMSAQVMPDGSLGKVAGIEKKLLAAIPVVHTLVVAEPQEFFGFKLEATRAEGVFRVQGAEMQVVKAATLPEAIERLRIALGRFNLAREDLPLRDDMFVGRRKLLDKLIPTFIHGRSRGFLILPAPMGYGKTALMAEVVHREKERGHRPVYYFAQSQDPSKNVCEALYIRLITKYPRLRRSTASSDTERLKEQLEFVSQALRRRAANEPDAEKRKEIKEVLYFDGADQIQRGGGEFLLPQVIPKLPPRVLCIITTRNDQSWMKRQFAHESGQTHVRKLVQSRDEDQRKQQRQDIAEYLALADQRLEEPLGEELRRQIAETGDVPPNFFTISKRVKLLLRAQVASGAQKAKLQWRDHAFRDPSRVALWHLPPNKLIYEEAARFEDEAAGAGIDASSAWNFLGILAAAVESLSEDQLREMGLWEPHSGRICDLAASFFEPRPLEHAAPLPYRFDHPGYQRFILRSKRYKTEAGTICQPKLGSYGAARCHTTLANACKASWQVARYALAHRLEHHARAHTWRPLLEAFADVPYMTAVCGDTNLGWASAHAALLPFLEKRITADAKEADPDCYAALPKIERFLRKRIERLRELPDAYAAEIMNECFFGGRSRIIQTLHEIVRSSFRDAVLPQKVSGPPSIPDFGHNGGVEIVAHAAVGPYVASVSHDTIKVWNAATGRLQADLAVQHGFVEAIAFSSDGLRLCSRSYWDYVVWDVVTGRRLRDFYWEVHSAGSPSQDWIDHLKIKWDELSGGLFRDCTWIWGDRGDDCVSQVRGLRAFGGSELSLYEASTGRLLRTFTGHIGRITSVCISPDERKIASGGNDNTVKLWECATGRLLVDCVGHIDRVCSLSFSPDGRKVVSGSADKSVKIWNVPSGEIVYNIAGETRLATGVCFSQNGSIIASGSAGGIVKIWDVGTGKVFHVYEFQRGYKHTASLSWDGRVTAAGAEDDSVKVWDTSTGRLLSDLHGHMSYITSLCFSATGRRLASGSDDGSVKLWEPHSGTLVHDLRGHLHDINALRFSPDGGLLASASSDGTIKVWDVSGGTLLYNLSGHASWIGEIAFSPDGRMLASGSADRTLKIWRTGTGELLYNLEQHTEPVNIVSFATDNRVLASGSRDKTVKLWDPHTGKLLCNCQEHTGSISSIAFSPDGRLLASTGDFTVRIWDARSGALCSVLYFDPPPRAAFFMDSRQLQLRVTTGEPGQVWTYNIVDNRVAGQP